MSVVRRLVVLTLALGLGVLPRSARAQDLTRLFPEEADIFTTAPGLVRLPLPPAVLAATTPDLADVRIFDRAGREVPYLIDPGVPSGLERREHISADARVSDLSREEIPREGARSLTREVYRVAVPAKPPAGDAWTLVVDSAQPRFVRGVEVRGVAADGSERVLVPRASLVRLGQPLVDRDRIPLPPFDGAAIVLTIAGEEGFFLEPTIGFESDRKLAPASLAEVALPLLEQHREGQRTIVTVARPPALVSARLRLTTATSAFDRRVTVRDVAADGSAAQIGAGRVVRAPSPDQAAATDRVDVDVVQAHGDKLRIEIEDGDSPPLADLELSLVFSQPALLFALPAAAAGEPAGVLRFGGKRAYAPRYDIAALFADARAASAELLADPTRLPTASLGPLRPNPSFDAAPALAAVMRAGPKVEVDAWRWQRPITVPASPEGLAQVRLDAADLAQALANHADLRIVDAEGRQWPYVLAPAVERASVVLRAQGPVTKDGTSRWQIVLPTSPLLVDRLLLDTARPVLSRRFRLLTRDDDGTERVLAAGTLAQELRRPGPIAIAIAPWRVSNLELQIEDGNDAPSEITRIVAPVVLPSLLVAAPAGAYTLLAGNPDATPPQYEIARARDVVLDLRSVPARVGQGAENAHWSGTPGGTMRRNATLQQLAIWAVIGLAVLVLGVLTLRVVQRTD